MPARMAAVAVTAMSLGTDLGEPVARRDAHAGATRRADTDNDIYM